MENKKPRVSVITAVYNGEKYLGQAIQSVLDQTFANFDYIIVDDASTDRTPEVIQGFNDKRIRYFRNQERKERSYSRNRAINQARGEYVAILDADDVWKPDKLEKQMEFLTRHPEIDVLGANFIRIDNNGNEDGETTNYPQNHNLIVWTNLFGSPVAHSSAMMKTSVITSIGGYDVNWAVEDADLWIRMAKAGARFANLNEPLVKYRSSIEQDNRYKKKLSISRERRRLYIEKLVNQPVDMEAFDLLFLSYKSDLSKKISDKQLIYTTNLMLSIFKKMENENYFIRDGYDSFEEYITAGIGRLSSHSPTFVKTVLPTILRKLPSNEMVEYYWLNHKNPFIIRWLGFMIMEPGKFIKKLKIVYKKSGQSAR